MENENVQYVTFDDRGAIRTYGVCQISTIAKNTPQGLSFLAVDSVYHPIDFYVKDGEVVPRPENPAVLDGMFIRNIPENSTLLIEGVQYPASGDVELEFTLPGNFIIKLKSFPEKRKEFNVTVN
jgi:hypothetical protein